MRIAARDALVLVVAASGLGLAANLVHPHSIPYVAREEYQTLVPCPTSGGPVAAVEAAQVNAPAAFLIDARHADAFAAFHLEGAVNVPYDYLDPTSEKVLDSLAHDIASSGARRVVVYGDGDEPDSGAELGKEISAFGIRNVYYVSGGAPALGAGP